MDLYGFFVILFIVIIFIVILPIVSNVGSFKVNKPSSKKNGAATGSKRQRLKDAINDPNILKFRLKKGEVEEEPNAFVSSNSGKTGVFEVDSKTGLKKRVIGKFSADPSTFDFDIDDLIDEDKKEEEQEMNRRFQKHGSKAEKVYDEFV